MIAFFDAQMADLSLAKRKTGDKSAPFDGMKPTLIGSLWSCKYNGN